jgi:NADPH:quinone reductase
MAAEGDPDEVLRFGELAEPTRGAGEVVIEVECAGASFADLLLIKGEYQINLPVPGVPGSEIVGRVTAAGPETSLAVGTRVIGLALPPDGAFAESCVALAERCEPIPDAVEGPAAVALIGNYVTAHLALHRVAKLRPDEVAVVLGGAGGVGTAAIQVAKAAGARVIGADLGPDRAKGCEHAGADLGVDSTDPKDLARAVETVTAGRGADVVLDLVGGTLFEAARRFMAFEGRIVIAGFTSGHIPTLRLNQLILRSFTVQGVNALTILEQHVDIHRAARRAVVDLLADGKLAPAIGAVYPLPELIDGLAALRDGQVAGKAVIRVRDSV